MFSVGLIWKNDDNEDEDDDDDDGDGGDLLLIF